MLKITDRVLLERVGIVDSFKKGLGYYETGRVREIKTTPNHDYFIGNVYGSHIYQSMAKFNKHGDLVDTSCTCQAYEKYMGDCKHIVALLMTIREFDETGKLTRKQSEGNIKNILHHYREKQNGELIKVKLEINYEREGGESYLDLKIGEDKLYVVKGIGKFLSDLTENKAIEFGKNFNFYPEIHGFNEKDKEIIDFLTILYENYEINHYNYYGSRWDSTFKGKRVKLSPKSLERFFDLVKGREFNIINGRDHYNDVIITDEKLELKFKIQENKEDLILNINEDNSLAPLTEDGKYFFYKDKVYKLSEEQLKTIMPIYNEILSKDMRHIRIDKDFKEVFVSEILPSIKKHSNLSLDKNVEESIYSQPIHASIYFDRKDEMILGRLIFNYGEIDINPFSSKEKTALSSDKILLRDIEEERMILNLLELGDFKVEDGGFYLEEEEEIFDFINDIIPELQKHCEVYYSDTFKNIGLISSENFTGGLRLNSELDMLEFNFDIEGIDISELGDVFKALKEKKRYYKLKDGSFLSLENRELDDIVDILDYLDLDAVDLQNGNIAIPRFRTMYLDKFIKDRGMDFIKRNVDFKRLVRDINDPEDIEYEIPRELNASLRDYQKFGFKWLKTLSNYGFGGILADEMGLGKTVQMIAFLLSEKKEKGSEASIVIVPTSLVYNWEDEVKRFGPSLKTLVVVGNKAERDELIKRAEDYDLVITSYPLVRKDVEEYRKITFRHCILDEAQHIKNHGSLNAKSVKNIKAKNYFALTGTPMENSLSELWSIFDFLMPGYLLSSGKFSEKFEKPIVKDHDNLKLKDLNNHIKPFILRRLKKEVLKELPDKIEQKIVVEMTKEQKKLYLAYLQAIKGELNEEISLNGYNKSHIRILAGLTRLRQLCCHPSVFVEDYKGGSGKLDSLEEIVEEAMEGGHRILIFSQFTTMLGKIRELLEAKKVHCLYLDGSTPVMERGDLVREFNRGVGDVFLISLKAGGTGLNLTSADMVIHFDPWWNPAVEDQATDRAHRIGQENTVQVIKLITKGTIEEKIFQLQEKKKEMIDKVITEGETLISKLSEEEIMSLFDI